MDNFLTCPFVDATDCIKFSKETDSRARQINRQRSISNSSWLKRSAYLSTLKYHSTTTLLTVQYV